MIPYPEILRLQLQERRSTFASYPPAIFTQKGRHGSNEHAEKIKQHYLSDLRINRWKFASRAKVAVGMVFFSNRGGIPSLHKLVKHYLDTMQSVLFTNDRQVHYLAARCARPTRSQKDAFGTDSFISIEVQRLVAFKRRLKLYEELNQSRGTRDHQTHDYDDDSDLLEIDDDIHLRPGIVESIRRLRSVLLQERLLKLSRIQSYDIPGASLLAQHLPEEVAKLRQSELFTVQLGDLPSIGESGQYRSRIRDSLMKMRDANPHFREILVPVELDVQLTLSALELGKDLDNIMCDICSVLQDALLRDDAFVAGYRIYVTSKLTATSPNGIRIKLLPMGAIGDLEEQMERVFDEALDEM